MRHTIQNSCAGSMFDSTTLPFGKQLPFFVCILFCVERRIGAVLVTLFRKPTF